MEEVFYMLTNFSAIITDFLSVIMSLLLSFGSFFGTMAPPTTETPDNYYDEGIKNVIFLTGISKKLLPEVGTK